MDTSASNYNLVIKWSITQGAVTIYRDISTPGETWGSSLGSLKDNNVKCNPSPGTTLLVLFVSHDQPLDSQTSSFSQNSCSCLPLQLPLISATSLLEILAIFIEYFLYSTSTYLIL